MKRKALVVHAAGSALTTKNLETQPNTILPIGLKICQVFFFFQLSKFLFECQDSNSSFGTFLKPPGSIKALYRKIALYYKRMQGDQHNHNT